ncbi:MAG TPA: DNA helicase, partial [Rhodoblastus sp.]|nr:DNA helicase [Rhodoblastus sp.]
AAFFTLEYTERDVRDRFRVLGADCAQFEGSLVLDCSDAIDAGHIVRALQAAPRGALVVVDYLQLLDRRRDSATLDEQARLLKAFAVEKGAIVVVLAQIDRSFVGSRRDCPDLRDIRLSNPLDLRLFNKTCFLNAGKRRFRVAA